MDGNRSERRMKEPVERRNESIVKFWMVSTVHAPNPMQPKSDPTNLRFDVRPEQPHFPPASPVIEFYELFMKEIYQPTLVEIGYNFFPSTFLISSRKKGTAIRNQNPQSPITHLPSLSPIAKIIGSRGTDEDERSTPSSSIPRRFLLILNNFIGHPRSSMSQERLNGLAMLCIEKEMMDNVDLDTMSYVLWVHDMVLFFKRLEKTSSFKIHSKSQDTGFSWQFLWVKFYLAQHIDNYLDATNLVIGTDTESLWTHQIRKILSSG
ncbi:hypothetical protein LXL04_008408 [Taraxacum kok-saghyz]